MHSVISFGLEAIRTAALINGGAVIAVFAFLKALYGADGPEAKAMIGALQPAAFMFAAGAIFSGLASGFAYFAQYLYPATHVKWQLTWEFPYIKEGEGADRLRRFAAFWHALCIAFVIASYSITVLALWSAGRAMTLS
ncbi:hypothetical protein [Ensifer aridi]|uniref:hypothetical protein n=1 Tax=Ensifer aridi TaxID=1708715 RepID=UPI000A11B065|nr:hypothetical protein [Ensifer aridi]